MGWKSLTAWGLVGVYAGCKVALVLNAPTIAPSQNRANFDAYHLYIKQQEQPAIWVDDADVPETSPYAEYVLGLPRVAMPEIPRPFVGPVGFSHSGAGSRGTLTKSKRFHGTTRERSAGRREYVVRSIRSRVARAVFNYGVSGYGFH